jgi:lipopolysaccharide transport system permease protein
VSRPGDGARWREILFYQSYCQLRLESERLYIGYLWWAVETILEMGVLYVVFRELLDSPLEHYLSFLLCGLVSWRWLSQSVTRAAGSILQNQPLASQVFVPKILFPLSMLIADAAKFGLGLVVLVVFLVFDGLLPSAAWVAFPVVLAVQLLFNAALALWAAAVVPFFRSVLVGLEVVLRFGMFLSGVFFDVDRIAEPLRPWLELNPMVHILRAWREVLMRGEWPDFAALGVIAALSAVAILAAHMFIVSRELDYPRMPA